VGLVAEAKLAGRAPSLEGRPLWYALVAKARLAGQKAFGVLQMNDKMIGVLLGGVAPALCFGVCSVLMKLAARTGIGLGPYVLGLALGVGLGGTLTLAGHSGHLVSGRGLLFALLVGLTWAAGMALIQVALTRYHAAISQVVPLHMLNLVVTIALGFALFAEAREVDAIRLVIGAALIGVGAILVAGA
jgi:transporter family protein